jgi:hypothetical protein
MERLFIQGDDKLGAKMGLIKTLRDDTFREARGYAIMLKDKNSTIVNQPRIWLSE